MSERELKELIGKLPKGTKFIKAYKAFEGDIRVIVKLPDRNYETRYTVMWENNIPKLVDM